MLQEAIVVSSSLHPKAGSECWLLLQVSHLQQQHPILQWDEALWYIRSWTRCFLGTRAKCLWRLSPTAQHVWCCQLHLPKRTSTWWWWNVSPFWPLISTPYWSDPSSRSRWELLLCSACGSKGVHIGCGRLHWSTMEWDCDDCNLQSKRLDRKEPERPQTRAISALSTPPPVPALNSVGPVKRPHPSEETSSDADSDVDVIVISDAEDSVGSLPSSKFATLGSVSFANKLLWNDLLINVSLSFKSIRTFHEYFLTETTFSSLNRVQSFSQVLKAQRRPGTWRGGGATSVPVPGAHPVSASTALSTTYDSKSPRTIKSSYGSTSSSFIFQQINFDISVVCNFGSSLLVACFCLVSV